jgi:hypothetical protein
MIGFVLPDKKSIERSVAGYAAKQAGYDDPPTYTPAEPDDSLKVWPPPRPFAPPREIARLTEARPKGRGWKNGLCPICNERQLSVWWGRHRDRTMIHCYAVNECQNIDVVKAISNRHRVSLDMRPSSFQWKPRRRLSETAGMTPIERALWHCTRAEQRLYEHLKKRGNGPVRFDDMPLGKNAGRAIPVLEYLGLVRAKRGRFDPYGGGRKATSYEAARLKLHRLLEGDDRKLEADLKAIRKANVDIEPTLKQDIKDGSQANNRCTTGKHTLKMTVIRTDSGGEDRASSVLRRMVSPAERRRRRRAARLAGAMAFTKAVGEMALAQGGRTWTGSWQELLAVVSRPTGSRAWPLSKQGVMTSVWLGRGALAALGLKHEWLHHVALSGRQSLRAIRIIPAAASAPEISVATGATG